jgi:hypothetical protein
MRHVESRWRAGLRWAIALIIVGYGFAKLNGSQFTVLDSELDRALGEVSGFWLTWYFFSYSRAYGTVVALAQIAGGLLLTSRRWWLAGALVLLPIIGNIVLVDIFYGIDFGGTMMAILLLAGLLVLVAPHTGRLLDLARVDTDIASQSRRRLAWVARVAMVSFAFGATWWIANFNNRRPTPVDGVWDVVAAEGAAADLERVYFERNRAFMAVFRDVDGAFVQRHFEVDDAGGVRVWSDWLQRGELLYEGALQDDGTVRLASADPAAAQFTLTRRAAGAPALQRERQTMRTATGTFEVTITAAMTDEDPGGTTLGRSSLDKRFHGDLDGTSAGEMLTAITGVAGSAGYVALERVRGTLHGRAGSFVLQHSGTMTRGAQQLTLTVVPDSGTDELEGIAGTMQISIEDGRHAYEFEYALAGR